MKLLVFFAAFTLSAQTGEVKVDTPQVRAVVVTYQPRRATAIPQYRTNRLLIYLDDGEMSFTAPNGEVEKSAFKAGDARWSPAGPAQIRENLTTHPVRVVEIELKSAPRGFTPSALDPLNADPKNYSLEFENEQVRVLRVRFAAREKGVRHEHQLNHIVIYLTDHAKGPAGTVKIEGPEVHTEENPLDRAVERIAVDLK